MSLVGAGLILLIVALPVGALLLAVVTALRPVGEARVARFVRRTGVPLTAGNAPFVLDALGRTMRWRTAGVVVAVSLVMAWDVLHESVTFDAFDGVVLAAGFLLGSVVGEVGNAMSRGTSPRSASLEVRREQDYVGSWARTWPRNCALAAIPLTVAMMLLHRDGLAAMLMTFAAVLPWAASRWSTRLVLERSRPAADGDDVVAADDGLRSRALHAIGGAAVLASSWSVITLAAVLLLGTWASDLATIGVLVAFVAMFGLARRAWTLATGPFPIGRLTAQGAVTDRAPA